MFDMSACGAGALPWLDGALSAMDATKGIDGLKANTVPAFRKLRLDHGRNGSHISVMILSAPVPHGFRQGRRRGFA
jgi:hypothetical protein